MAISYWYTSAQSSLHGWYFIVAFKTWDYSTAKLDVDIDNKTLLGVDLCIFHKYYMFWCVFQTGGFFNNVKEKNHNPVLQLSCVQLAE